MLQYIIYFIHFHCYWKDLTSFPFFTNMRSVCQMLTIVKKKKLKHMYGKHTIYDWLKLTYSRAAMRIYMYKVKTSMTHDDHTNVKFFNL